MISETEQRYYNFCYICRMELFYSRNIASGDLSLDSEESNHCVKVLRHRRDDIINVVDGHGVLYKCRILDDNPKGVSFTIEETIENYGSHNYRLHIAVAPPKNTERFEWFAGKATEIGVDEITPLFGDYSERKVFKPERTERILVSAAKQSHKGAIPLLHEAVSVKEFIMASENFDGSKLICYCDDISGKVCINDVLNGSDNLIIMVGPEGDFSREEVSMAIERGFIPVSLGDSRLRIETAALVAVTAVYLKNINS